MARLPNSTWKPLPENDTQPRINPTQIILHIACSEAKTLHGYFSKPGVGVESHFYTRYDGSTEQYIDTNVRADANYKANGRAISVETQGGSGHWRDVDTQEWTPQQCDELARILAWAHREHGIPLRHTDGPDGPGVGWHSKHQEWSVVQGKTCPGRGRINQINGIIDAAKRLVSGPETPNPGRPHTPIPLPYELATLTAGDTGPAVKRLQNDLAACGMDLGKYGADGQYGLDTERAVGAFQAAAGLHVDGRAGKDTKRCLATILGRWRFAGTARKGDRGEATRQCQILLTERGYGLGGAGVDGRFGNDTRDALAAAQRQRGLDTDGVYGPNSFIALNLR